MDEDRLIADYFARGFSYRLILCFLSSCHGIFMSLRTLKRRLSSLNLKHRGYYSSLRHAGSCLLRELYCSGSMMGYRAMHHKLRVKYGVKIPRDVVAGMLSAVDPVGANQRHRRRLVQRRYKLKGPNFCWHIDGNDKLKAYGFAIHGCIDGFSRKLLWLEVSITNNDSSVIGGFFLDAVAEYNGCPRILRCDRGTENAKIAYLQPFLRRDGHDSLAGEASFQYGRSATNQRIEWWWSMLKKWLLSWWMDFFKILRETGEFDNTNPIHLDCIRFCFIDLLQRELDEAKAIWNGHLIRRARSPLQATGIPDELYSIPQLHVWSSTGFRDFKCTVQSGDLQFCQQYARRKPNPVPPEFRRLAQILMRENNWNMPTTCDEGFLLYLNLKNIIDFNII